MKQKEVKAVLVTVEQNKKMETYNFLALDKEGLELQIEISSNSEKEAIE